MIREVEFYDPNDEFQTITCDVIFNETSVLEVINFRRRTTIIPTDSMIGEALKIGIKNLSDWIKDEELSKIDEAFDDGR